jgi:hypothetical protein
VLELAAMNGCDTYRIVNGRLGRGAWLVGIAWAMVLGCVTCCGIARGQGAPGIGGQGQGASTIHGRVLNQITKEPIGRALVASPGDEYATLTDDRGQFEFRFSLHEGQGNSVGGGTGATGINRLPSSSHSFLARKPGYLQDGRNARPVRVAAGQTEVTIYLVPEALIVGHVNVPGSEGDVRIECELYKRGMREGQETWLPAGTFTTWADAEFRFSGLEAGTYKLITHEQMDRDSLLPIPGAQLFGYPPIYYPNTTDFSVAGPIVVRAGETAQVNLAVARREYYPVRIPVENVPASRPLNLVVYPMGHHSPGWSLGYNPMEHTVEGMLPDGNYTVEADAQGEAQSTGILNFSMKGAAFEGPALNLIPNASLNVNVHGQQSNVQVSLTSIDELGSMRGRFSLRAKGSEGQELTIPNVRPGRYHVNVFSGKGYAASIQSGGSDLMQQPLVVGLGGGNSPIEITLRDDGGEVSGTVEEATSTEGNSVRSGENPQFRYVYLLPMGESTWPQPPTVRTLDGTFKMEQVAPGDYLVAAFDQVQQDLPYGSEEALRPLEGKGQAIHVEAGQKVNVRVKVNAGSDGE